MSMDWSQFPLTLAAGHGVSIRDVKKITIRIESASETIASLELTDSVDAGVSVSVCDSVLTVTPWLQATDVMLDSPDIVVSCSLPMRSIRGIVAYTSGSRASLDRLDLPASNATVVIKVSKWAIDVTARLTSVEVIEAEAVDVVTVSIDERVGDDSETETGD